MSDTRDMFDELIKELPAEPTPEQSPPPPEPPATECWDRTPELLRLPIAEIRLPPCTPRLVYREEAIQTMADSIREHGILQPLLVRPLEGGYELIAGGTRYRGALAVDLEHVPAYVRHVSDEEAQRMALEENGRRDDLAPWDEAAECGRLRAREIENHRPATVESIAALTPWSVGKVSERLQIHDALPTSLWQGEAGLTLEDMVALPKSVLLDVAHAPKEVRVERLQHVVMKVTLDSIMDVIKGAAPDPIAVVTAQEQAMKKQLGPASGGYRCTEHARKGGVTLWLNPLRMTPQERDRARADLQKLLVELGSDPDAAEAA